MAGTQATVPIVIDTDPGIDDVVALALAARSPELRVQAVTTTYGNATLAATTRNARAALELAGAGGTPVHPGADRPLARSLVTAPETHGPTGVGHAPVAAERPVTPDPTVLLDVLEEVDWPVTLVTLGPLTNLAHAVEVGGEFVRQRVARHIGMFGNIHERGNTNRWADFNAWSDPEAADRVLGAGLATEMVGLDVTRRMELSAGAVEHLASASDPLTSWLGRALRFYVQFHRSQERLDGCVVNDVLPLGELIAPGLLTLADLRLAVDLGEGEHRGRTVERPDGVPTRVALEVDIHRMRELLGRVFGDDWAG
jgi:pyrimidine-specific ribonucleoside hydrolase